MYRTTSYRMASCFLCIGSHARNGWNSIKYANAGHLVGTVEGMYID